MCFPDAGVLPAMLIRVWGMGKVYQATGDLLSEWMSEAGAGHLGEEGGSLGGRCYALTRCSP